MRRLLILTAALSFLSVGCLLSETPAHAFAAAQDSGSGATNTTGTTNGAPAPSASAILSTAQQYLGYPYAYIGDDPSTGFSCIGFAHYVFAQNGVYVPEDLGKAYGSAPHVEQSDLQPGDLVFFQNTVWDGISHVDLYIGGGKMIGADTFQTGVEQDNLTDSYWQDHYLGATRPISNPTGTPLDPSTIAITSSSSLAPPPVPSLSVKSGSVVSPRYTATVYSGPGSTYASIDTVTSDMTLTAVQAQGEWVNVSYGDADQYGWVRGRDLNLPPGATTPVTGTSSVDEGIPMTPSQPISATTAASSTTPISATTAASSTNKLAPVQNVKGYHETVRQGRVLIVVADVLYLRASGDLRSRIVRRVHAGDRLRLLNTRKGWDYVAQRDGFRGWVSAKWVRQAKG